MLVDSLKRSCGGEEKKSPEHIIQERSSHRDLRREIYPTPITSDDKRYVRTDTLKLTADFIQRTSLSL